MSESKEKEQSRRQALYFPAEMLSELQKEALRQDRSLSWLIQQAWRVSKRELQRVPSTTDYLPTEPPAEFSAGSLGRGDNLRDDNNLRGE